MLNTLDLLQKVTVSDFRPAERNWLSVRKAGGQIWRFRQRFTFEFVPSVNRPGCFVPYFLCPKTNVRARVLYRCPASGLFVHRSGLPGKWMYRSQKYLISETSFAQVAALCRLSPAEMSLSFHFEGIRPGTKFLHKNGLPTRRQTLFWEKAYRIGRRYGMNAEKVRAYLGV